MSSHRGLLDHHRREAAGQRAVALDLAVLGERRGADHPQLAAGEHRLEQVGGVHPALGVARAEDRVQLVDEEHDPALCRRDLLERALQALLELAAELAAGHHRAHVERHDAALAQGLGHVALRRRAARGPRRWRSCRRRPRRSARRCSCGGGRGSRSSARSRPRARSRDRCGPRPRRAVRSRPNSSSAGVLALRLCAGRAGLAGLAGKAEALRARRGRPLGEGLRAALADRGRAPAGRGGVHHADGARSLPADGADRSALGGSVLRHGKSPRSQSWRLRLLPILKRSCATRHPGRERPPLHPEPFRH